MIVSLSQGLSYRPPTKDDCLCQCDPYVSYQQYGSPQGNCRSSYNGRRWCYVKDVGPNSPRPPRMIACVNVTPTSR